MVVELTDEEAVELAELLEGMDDALLAEYGGPGATRDPEVSAWIEQLRQVADD